MRKNSVPMRESLFNKLPSWANSISSTPKKNFKPIKLIIPDYEYYWQIQFCVTTS